MPDKRQTATANMVIPCQINQWWKPGPSDFVYNFTKYSDMCL